MFNLSLTFFFDPFDDLDLRSGIFDAVNPARLCAFEEETSSLVIEQSQSVLDRLGRREGRFL